VICLNLNGDFLSGIDGAPHYIEDLTFVYRLEFVLGRDNI